MSDYELFILSLYDMSQEELKKLYKKLKDNRDELSQEVANILYKYTISDEAMDISKEDINKLYVELGKDINKGCKNIGKLEILLLEEILKNVIDSSCDYWNYNIEFKDVRNIIENNFKGKHFSDRVWDNENEVAKKLNKLTKDFLDGKVNVNQIKKEIEKTFNADAYNVKRLVETEIARVQDEAFKRFCKETDVKKIKRNAVLDSKTCNDCEEYDGVIYDLNKAPSLPSHPLCRCFYEIVD